MLAISVVVIISSKAHSLVFEKFVLAHVKCQIIHIIITQSLRLYIEYGYHWQFIDNTPVNRCTALWTLNTDGPLEKLISLACILAHVDSPNTMLSYIY